MTLEHHFSGIQKTAFHQPATSAGSAKVIGPDRLKAGERHPGDAGDVFIQFFLGNPTADDGFVVVQQRRTDHFAFQSHAGDQIKRDPGIPGGVHRIARRKQIPRHGAVDPNLDHRRAAVNEHDLLCHRKRLLKRSWRQRKALGQILVQIWFAHFFGAGRGNKTPHANRAKQRKHTTSHGGYPWRKMH